MLFNSFPFLLLFLPCVLLITLCLKGKHLLAWIAISSYVFYLFAGHAWFLVPMLATTLMDFKLGIALENSKNPLTRKLILGCSLGSSLILLATFKYSGLFFDARWTAWILPAGISFYTFQTMSYMIDIYRGQASAQHDFWCFASFVSFFPHLVAGPLTRHDQLIPQLKQAEKQGIEPRWDAAVFLFFIGLCKKTLLADPIGRLIDPVIANTRMMGFTWAWTCALGYSIQIYFDFSGYSDMAIGLGRFFGIELPQNFNKPYTAMNPSDFWKRWHITLSRWMRDYLYIPLGGNRSSQAKTIFALGTTMFLAGLWHGARWTFAEWGMYHAFWLMIYHRYQNWWDNAHPFVQQSLTFTMVTAGWVLFRAPSSEAVGRWFSRLFDFASLAHAPRLPIMLLPLILLGLLIEYRLPVFSKGKCFHDMNSYSQIGFGVLAAAALLFMHQSSKFLYFQF